MKPEPRSCVFKKGSKRDYASTPMRNVSKLSLNKGAYHDLSLWDRIKDYLVISNTLDTGLRVNLITPPRRTFALASHLECLVGFGDGGVDGGGGWRVGDFTEQYRLKLLKHDVTVFAGEQ